MRLFSEIYTLKVCTMRKLQILQANIAFATSPDSFKSFDPDISSGYRHAFDGTLLRGELRTRQCWDRTVVGKILEQRDITKEIKTLLLCSRESLMSKRKGPIRQKRGDSILQRGKIDGTFLHLSQQHWSWNISKDISIFLQIYHKLYVINYICCKLYMMISYIL